MTLLIGILVGLLFTTVIAGGAAFGVGPEAKTAVLFVFLLYFFLYQVMRVVSAQLNVRPTVEARPARPLGRRRRSNRMGSHRSRRQDTAAPNERSARTRGAIRER